MTIEQKVMKQHLNVLKIAIPKYNRTIQPILDNVRVNAQGFQTSDMDTHIHVHTPTGMDETEDTTAPFKLIEKFVTKQKECLFDFKQQNGTLRIDSRRMKTDLKTLDSSEFPVDDFPSSTESENAFRMSLSQLRYVFDRLNGSWARYETSNVLGGVNFKYIGDILHIAATDGSRLHKVELKETFTLQHLKIDTPLRSQNGITIPGDTMNAMVKALKHYPNTTRVCGFIDPESNRIRFTVGVYDITINLLEGSYPLYQQLIPLENKNKIAFDVDTLTETLKAIAPFTNERTNIIKMSTKPGETIILAVQPDACETSTTIENISNCTQEVAFNHNWLLDALKSMSGAVQFENNGSLAPTILMDECDDFKALVMPVQIK